MDGDPCAFLHECPSGSTMASTMRYVGKVHNIWCFPDSECSRYHRIKRALLEDPSPDMSHNKKQRVQPKVMELSMEPPIMKQKVQPKVMENSTNRMQRLLLDNMSSDLSLFEKQRMQTRAAENSLNTISAKVNMGTIGKPRMYRHFIARDHSGMIDAATTKSTIQIDVKKHAGGLCKRPCHHVQKLTGEDNFMAKSRVTQDDSLLSKLVADLI